MRCVVRIALVALSMGGWFTTGAAHAQPESEAPAQSETDQQAKTHFASGRLYFDRGDYEAALREFEAAYHLSARVGLLYNIYLTLERLGRHQHAAERLEQFLALNKDIAEEKRANLEARLGKLRARAQSDARKAERDAQRNAPASQSSAAVSQDEKGPLFTRLGIAGLSVGAAGLIAFSIAGGLALSEDGDLADRCGSSAGRVCTSDDVSRLNRLNLTADISLYTGLAFAVAGGALLTIALVRRNKREERLTLTPAVGRSVAGISVSGEL